MEINGNYYRCNKCSRITQTYPLGCRTKQCPVKKDVLNDTIYGTFVGLILTAIVFAGIYMAARYVHMHPSSQNKPLDYSIERRYTK